MPPIKPVASPRQRVLSISELESENRRLKDELFLARRALIDLLDTQGILAGYARCEDLDEVDEWRQKTTAALIKAAWVRPGEEMGDPSSPRAICPLCRQGAITDRGAQGFSVPGGLRRHLLGELNSRQCRVFHAAEQLAWEHARSRDGAL